MMLNHKTGVWKSNRVLMFPSMTMCSLCWNTSYTIKKKSCAYISLTLWKLDFYWVIHCCMYFLWCFEIALLTTRLSVSVPEKLTNNTYLLMGGKNKWVNEWPQTIILLVLLLITKWPLTFFDFALTFSTIYFVYQNPVIKLNE